MGKTETSDVAEHFAELSGIHDLDLDLRAVVIRLVATSGATAMRWFACDDGEVREIAAWPGHDTSAAMTPGLRLRLQRPRAGSRVRLLSSKARRVWAPLLADGEPSIVLELVAAQRLIGALIFTPSLAWLDAAAQEAGWLARRLDPWLGPLTARVRVWTLEHELARVNEQAVQGQQLRLESLTFDDDRQEIVGASGGLRPVMERVEMVAGSDVPVMLFGETGSGKEVVARALHEGSARRREPFVRVNCGAIPAELIDSQLFGHERGSFTGATEQRKGWFERANGGTLFLDEVGELPLAAQVRLLRVLQDHTFERVGGQTPVEVDCRIIAATHRDLPAMVQAGQFREDLWYRLAVFPLVIPPLRERTVDIPALARYFARRAIRYGLPPCSPSEDDLRLLLAYDWPGNVRELSAVIDRAAILGRGRGLDVATALGPTARKVEVERKPFEPAAAARTGKIATLDEASRIHIENVLAVCEGQIEGPRGAARMLDINPHTLRSRMRKLGVDWQRFRDR